MGGRKGIWGREGEPTGDMGVRPGPAVSVVAGVLQDRRHAGRAEEVDLNGRIERGVEVDSCGGVDHGGTAQQRLAACFIKAQALESYVGCQRDDPASRLFIEPAVEVATEPVETVVPKHVALYSLFGPAPAWPYEQYDLCIGQASQYSLGQGRTQEARGASDSDAPASKRLTEHLPCLPRRLGGARRSDGQACLGVVSGSPRTGSGPDAPLRAALQHCAGRLCSAGGGSARRLRRRQMAPQERLLLVRGRFWGRV